MGLASCNDDFMQQIPKTALTTEGFFNSAGDLETYVNGLYNDDNLYSKGWYDDSQSDNVAIKTPNNEMYDWLLTDLRSSDNTGGWDGWNSLRSVNLMLTNLDRVTGAETDIKNYVGIARYFRAWFYINKVQSYSDVPWIDKPLSTTDEALYAKQTPREEVVEHIFADLDSAVIWIKADMGDKTRIHKYCALALISRFALYEGTFRKYHPELGLESTANDLLKKSIAASEELMKGPFEITGVGTTDLSAKSVPGVVGAEGFRKLFTELELKDNKEVIQWRKFGEIINKAVNNSDLLMTKNGRALYSLSRSLQESFLTKDGYPYSTVEDYAKKTLSEVFINRDPRFAETFAWPGIGNEASGQPPYTVPNPQRGGYSQGKHFIRTYNRDTFSGADVGQYNGLPIYRYAEILLNYAEAKAELGELTEDVINKTINVLRDRVEMPHFDAAREVDVTLKDLYPQIANNNTLLAIRRERRVELAGEGFRLTDINRWYAGKALEKDISKQGIYVGAVMPAYVYKEPGTSAVKGFGIAATSDDKTNDKVDWYYLDKDPFYIDAAGFVRNNDDNNRHFDEPKDYYRPIPRQQIILNPNLKQPYGWE
jgi:hypothetical protein